MSRGQELKPLSIQKKAFNQTNLNQIGKWTTLDYQRESETAVQSICDASVDEDDDYLQYHELTSQHLWFREDAQARLQSPQLNHPYNSRHFSSYENLVIGGTHQTTRFMMEEGQAQQQHELLNISVQEVPMIEVLQEKPGIRKEEKSKTIDWLGRVPNMEPDMQTCMSNIISDIMEHELESVMQEQQVPQEDTVFARPPSRQQSVSETLKKKAAEQLSSNARLVNPADINLNAITGGSPDLLNSSKINSDQIQSDKFYQLDSCADKLQKEKEVGDYIDRVIAEETIKLQNESVEKKDRVRPKGRRNKSLSELSNTHKQEPNQEDYGHIQDSSSITLQQYPAIFRALRKPRKPRQLSGRANVPYFIIAGLALHNAKIPLPSKEIYRFARYYFPQCMISSSWKNSLRHILCTNGLFQKQDGLTGGNASLWTIDYAKIGTLWKYIATFVTGNKDPSTYGMTDPSLWGKLLEGSLGILDEEIQVNIGDLNRPTKSPKKRASQERNEGDITPEKQRCYGRQQPTSIIQNYQHIPHFERPYQQMANIGCDEYGYQQMTNGHHSHPDGFYPSPQNMHFHYYNQHMQMPTYANNQHPPTVFPGYRFADPSHPSPFPSLFVPNLSVQMPFPLMTSFHEESTSPESQNGLQCPMAHLDVKDTENGQNGGEYAPG